MLDFGACGIVDRRWWPQQARKPRERARMLGVEVYGLLIHDGDQRTPTTTENKCEHLFSGVPAIMDKGEQTVDFADTVRSAGNGGVGLL